MNKLLLYLCRWQLSTPILAIVTMYTVDKIGSFYSAIIANLIGGLIFYKIDKLIFNKGTKNTIKK
jgi:hypothetical protein